MRTFALFAALAVASQPAIAENSIQNFTATVDASGAVVLMPADGGAPVIPGTELTTRQSDAIEDVAREIARQLMAAVAGTACALQPPPETFTAGAKVSFNVGLSGEVNVSATWKIADLCP